MAESQKIRKAFIIPYLRWWMCGLLFASTAINYIDRQTVSVLGPYLKVQFHWSNSDFALILIAFRFAYAFGETACGRFLDKLGTRIGLLISVSFYSLAAMFTGLAVGLRSFVGMRFLVGAGNPQIGQVRQKLFRNGFRNPSEVGRSLFSTADRPLAEQLCRPLFYGCITISAHGAPSSLLRDLLASYGCWLGSSFIVRLRFTPISVRPNAKCC